MFGINTKTQNLALRIIAPNMLVNSFASFVK
jgi:hypothetical protein